MKLLSKFFNFVETHLGAKSKLTIGVFVLSSSLLGLHALLPKENDIVEGSVLITNMSETSGGTGVILKSGSSVSTIITNSHVCHGVEHGGVVKTQKGEKFVVMSYMHSGRHDICQISVSGNLGYDSKIATKSPISYYESALISGHPALLPNVVTSGHFSGQQIIQVVAGFRPCTEEDFKNPALGLLCALSGGMPIIKQYQSVLVTATIMPGSSGSGVYNTNKELVGLAFAGSGEIGYAWTVPFVYLKQFLEEERHSLKETLVGNEVTQSGPFPKSSKVVDSVKAMANLKTACKGQLPSELSFYCKLAEQDLSWSK